MKAAEVEAAAGTRKIEKERIFIYTAEGAPVSLASLKFTNAQIPASGPMHDFFQPDRGLFVEIGDLGRMRDRLKPSAGCLPIAGEVVGEWLFSQAQFRAIWNFVNFRRVSETGWRNRWEQGSAAAPTLFVGRCG